jgi:ribonuclease HI
MTTNNRMELRAAIEGLRALKKKCRVEIFSDSQYVVNGMTQWMPNWERQGFRNAQKKEIANGDLWRDLNDIAANHQVSWHWVRGHSGNELNERVDEIAREQAGLAMHQMRNK